MQENSPGVTLGEMGLVHVGKHRKTIGKPWENGGFMGFNG